VEVVDAVHLPRGCSFMVPMAVVASVQISMTEVKQCWRDEVVGTWMEDDEPCRDMVRNGFHGSHLSVAQGAQTWKR
jgi:hypothetical protein